MNVKNYEARKFIFEIVKSNKNMKFSKEETELIENMIKDDSKWATFKPFSSCDTQMKQYEAFVSRLLKECRLLKVKYIETDDL